jgi:hypothetical protein
MEWRQDSLLRDKKLEEAVGMKTKLHRRRFWSAFDLLGT